MIDNAGLLDVPDDIVDFNRWAKARGWSDGLPLIPPTPTRVQAFLDRDGGDPARTIALHAPRYSAATVQLIATN